jgi:lipopolysaccharide transport system ATP-binding protein
MKTTFGAVQHHSLLQCKIESLPLLPGTYFVNVGLFPTDWSFVYDFHWQMHPFTLISAETPGMNAAGVVSLQTEWAVTSIPANAFRSASSM